MPSRAAVRCRRTCKLDAPSAGGQGGGAGVCREHLLGDGAPDTQKNELKPWKKKEWCIPKVSGEFVATDGGCAGPLSRRVRPGASGPCVLTRPPSSCSGMCGLPLRPLPDGWGAMTPSTSETGPGTCSCSVNRRVAWRRVEVTGRRTAVDFAHRMKWLVDQAYPDATVVRLVLVNAQHPQVGLAHTRHLRTSEARRHSGAPGVSPHTRSRKLAEHG